MSNRGLRPRPQPAPEILAMVAAATEACVAGVAPTPAAPELSAWRFSGRWFGPASQQHRRRP